LFEGGLDIFELGVGDDAAAEFLGAFERTVKQAQQCADDRDDDDHLDEGEGVIIATTQWSQWGE
jgi:hypothetical protein